MPRFGTLACLSPASSLRRRHLLMPVILFVHLLLLAAVALLPAAPLPTRAPRVTFAVFDVETPTSEPRPPSPAPPPPQPAPLIMPEPLIKLAVETQALPASPVFDLATAAAAGFGTTCDVAATLVRAFESNDAARVHLDRLGPTSRSVANAIMLWDGAWVQVPGEAPDDALESIRRAIIEGAQAAPPECRAQDVAGPRFISVRDGTRTTTLVIGSGAWRWEQVIASGIAAEPSPAASTTVAPAMRAAAQIGGEI